MAYRSTPRFLVVSVADNKIEGMTVIKGLFPLIVLPLVGLVKPALARKIDSK